MARWHGKLVGFIAGALLLRSNPALGALIGLLIGHAIDRDWFRSRADDPYRVLGLDEDATQAEIDFAYRRLMSRCHPDRFATAGERRRRRAETEARAVNAAYDRIRTLRDRRAR